MGCSKMMRFSGEATRFCIYLGLIYLNLIKYSA